jgi:hypothetical protein
MARFETPIGGFSETCLGRRFGLNPQKRGRKTTHLPEFLPFKHLNSHFRAKLC